jgi:arylformamidase
MYDITVTTPGPLCYFADPFEATPVEVGSFIGSVKLGGAVNHAQVRFTPHGTGTHTECYGHLVADPSATIVRCLQKFKFSGLLISVAPVTEGNDLVVRASDVLAALPLGAQPEALVIRTLPNLASKQIQNYSGSNPPYLEAALADALVSLDIEHILLDLPSADKEEDGGALAFHRAFWQLDGPGPIRVQATITELVYASDAVPDGFYEVYIAPCAWELDAAPSRIWLQEATGEMV